MRKILPLLVVVSFVLSGLGAVGLSVEKENEEPQSQPRDYTHTVMVEVGTATWCPSCPGSNTAWHSIYGSGNYDFEYTELVYDKNSVASSRFNQFNPKYVPTSYWDGGQYAHPGTNYATFYSYLDGSGARAVPDLVATLDATWLGGANIEISYTVTNNEVDDYGGRIRIYVLELESTLWNDYSGNPYYHAFLDFAENKAINIGASDSISDTFTWDGGAAGYPSITANNIQIILAVFGDTSHQGYSDPPSGNPFTAYYSDECIATLPEQTQNAPPAAPDINGPNSGNANTEYDYTFVTTDPDGDDVYYWIVWGDGCPAVEWIGPYASGEEVTVSHAFTSQGDFTISAQAKDEFDNEGDWGYLEVTMPRIRNLKIFDFLQNHPILYQLLQRILNV